MRLELITSKDELRPLFSYIKVTKDICVATNAHVLGVIPTVNIFDDEFIEQLAERSILIHALDWKHIKAGCKMVWESNNIIEVIPTKGRSTFIKAEKEDSIGTYPKWENLIPTKEPTAIPLIGMNADLLFKLQKALNIVSCKLEFHSQTAAIKVSDIMSDGENYGIIMPCMIR